MLANALLASFHSQHDAHVSQVRNRRMSKREAEKLVKEVWKAKMAEEGDGQDTELIDFVYSFLQKRHGLQSAIIEASWPPCCCDMSTGRVACPTFQACFCEGQQAVVSSMC